MTQPSTSQARRSIHDFLEGGADVRAVIETAEPPEYRVWGSRKRSEEEKDLAREGRFIVFEKISEPTRLVPPIDWRQDPFQSQSWRAQLHTLRLLDVLFQMHFTDGEPSALGRAAEIVLDWISQNRPDRPGISEFAWFDKVVGDRAPYFAYLLVAGCQAGLLSEENARSLLRSVLDHAEFLIDDRNYTGESNHGLFQDAGLLLLGTYLPFLEEAERWRQHALARLLESLGRQVDIEEGVHLEHSPAYQYLMVGLVTKLLELAKIDDPPLQELAERMMDAGAWFVLPDGTVPPMGDSDPAPAPKWAQKAAGSKHGLKVFPSSGWAVVRDPATGSSLVVSAGYHGNVHKHPDELTFCLFEGGEPVVLEAGKYGYDTDDEERRYALSSAAHNVLIVDGESFPLKGSRPYGSGIRAGAEVNGWYAIGGTNELLRPQDVEHRRFFLYRPAFALIVVDEVQSDREHTYTRVFHLGPDLEVASEPELLSLRGSSFRGWLADDGAGGASRRMVRGQTEPEHQGWIFTGYRTGRETWTVEYESRAKSAIFVAALALTDAPVRAGLRRSDGEAIEIAVQGDGREFDLLLASTGRGLDLAERATPSWKA